MGPDTEPPNQPGYPRHRQPDYPKVEQPGFPPQAPPPEFLEQPPGYPPPPPTSQAGPGLASTVLIGCLVAVGLGAYGGLHEGTGYAINIAGFSSGLYVKSWLASVSALLGVVQLLSAMIMYGKLTATAPPWIGGLHRWSGRVAVLTATPVAMHCLYAVGFQLDSPRVLIHSIVGCLFYGAFVSKMLGLTRPNLPAKLVPVLGGVVFTTLIVLWLTSSLWLFSTQGVRF